MKVIAPSSALQISPGQGSGSPKSNWHPLFFSQVYPSPIPPLGTQVLSPQIPSLASQSLVGMNSAGPLLLGVAVRVKLILGLLDLEVLAVMERVLVGETEKERLLEGWEEEEEEVLWVRVTEKEACALLERVWETEAV